MHGRLRQYHILELWSTVVAMYIRTFHRHYRCVPIHYTSSTHIYMYLMAYCPLRFSELPLMSQQGFDADVRGLADEGGTVPRPKLVLGISQIISIAIELGP